MARRANHLYKLAPSQPKRGGRLLRGLSIRDAAFAKIFQTLGFIAHVLGDNSLHTIAASRCY
jgi:hypothetical protein